MVRLLVDQSGKTSVILRRDNAVARSVRDALRYKTRSAVELFLPELKKINA